MQYCLNVYHCLLLIILIGMLIYDMSIYDMPIYDMSIYDMSITASQVLSYMYVVCNTELLCIFFKGRFIDI